MIVVTGATVFFHNNPAHNFAAVAIIHTKITGNVAVQHSSLIKKKKKVIFCSCVCIKKGGGSNDGRCSWLLQPGHTEFCPEGGSKRLN